MLFLWLNSKNIFDLCVCWASGPAPPQSPGFLLITSTLSPLSFTNLYFSLLIFTTSKFNWSLMRCVKTFLVWCHFPGVRTGVFLQNGAAEQSSHSVGERRGSLWETATDLHPRSTEETQGERLLSHWFSWGLFWTETQTPGGDGACCCSLDKRTSQWDVQPPGVQK